ncbi:methyltransferase TYW3-domain-containing protein [Umbelopsis sp. AD052]|nr:methyltransferase TYW3-domain-containing protein [Umbelopsis sp. AD052]
MSLSTFQERKEKVISELVEEMNPNRSDKSPKGYIDAPILDLMRLINQHSQFYTTSSCSGRVAVYCEGVDDKKKTSATEAEAAKSTKGGKWLYVTHDPVLIPDTLDDKEKWILQLLFGDSYADLTMEPIEDDQAIINQQLVFFKFEPLILHVEAETTEAAHELLGLANVIGYQNSGITPSRTRHMLAIRSTHKLDVPVAAVHPTTQKIHLLVNTSYLYVLFRLSNQKFNQNIDRMKKFEQAVQSQLLTKDQLETKEQRRERKRRDGLERQKAVVGDSQEESDRDARERGRMMLDMYEDLEIF